MSKVPIEQLFQSVDWPVARRLFRLAEQAQRQLEKSGKFEDLNQISRPTELIRSYNSLYSQIRIDALDALDSIREISNADDLKSKLLFSVIVVCREKREIFGKTMMWKYFSLPFVMPKIMRKKFDRRSNKFFN